MEHKPKIGTKLLERLAELARVDLDKDKKKMLRDFKAIVDYFEELSRLDTKDVKPLIGGNLLENVFGEDVYDKNRQLPRNGAVEAFPDEQDGHLLIPPVL